MANDEPIEANIIFCLVEANIPIEKIGWVQLKLRSSEKFLEISRNFHIKNLWSYIPIVINEAYRKTLAIKSSQCAFLHSLPEVPAILGKIHLKLAICNFGTTIRCMLSAQKSGQTEGKAISRFKLANRLTLYWPKLSQNGCLTAIREEWHNSARY